MSRADWRAVPTLLGRETWPSNRVLHARATEDVLEQKHTEQSIEHSDDEQNTGNHKVPGQPDAGGADTFGGTRAGAENLEDAAPKAEKDTAA